MGDFELRIRAKPRGTGWLSDARIFASFAMSFWRVSTSRLMLPSSLPSASTTALRQQSPKTAIPV
jgi:hypothetical protein